MHKTVFYFPENYVKQQINKQTKNTRQKSQNNKFPARKEVAS